MTKVKKVQTKELAPFELWSSVGRRGRMSERRFRRETNEDLHQACVLLATAVTMIGDARWKTGTETARIVWHVHRTHWERTNGIVGSIWRPRRKGKRRVLYEPFRNAYVELVVDGAEESTTRKRGKHA